MPRITCKPLFLLTAIVLTLAASGCDTTADREMKRAEEALDKAMVVHADANASDDYNEAEKFFSMAQEASANNKIQEARDFAIKAKLCAEDAERKARERLKILDDEAEQLGK